MLTVQPGKAGSRVSAKTTLMMMMLNDQIIITVWVNTQ
jgi:hypothetical protein